MILRKFAATTLFALASFGLVTAGLVDQAAAHGGSDYTLTSQKLKLQSDPGNSKKNKFLYKTKDQIEINATNLLDSPAPSTVTTSLVVRGTGVDDGDSGVIVLDPAGWSAVGSKGYQFKVSSGVLQGGGIQKIKLLTHPKGGRLQIKAKGPGWGYDIVQPQGTIEISLTIGDQIYCAQYGANAGELTRNEGDLAEGGKVQGKSSVAIAGGECPSVCGNGLLEFGEECDDGNDIDNDTCSNTCTGCDPSGVDPDASTFDAIQAVIFDDPGYGCSSPTCHGAAQLGGLDLTEGNAFASLTDPAGSPDARWPGELRVVSGDDDRSLPYSNLHYATHGTRTGPFLPPAGPGGNGIGTAMPQGAIPGGGVIDPDHLEAIGVWIRSGASETASVSGTAELLNTCLPPSMPNKIAKPDAPATGVGVQFAMPGYDLLSQSERELCVVSYYDVSAEVPAQFKVPCPGTGAVNDTNECFAWDYQELAQDPQSHHSIIHLYTGSADTTDPGWGSWRCYGGDNHGGACDPLTPVACTGGGICGGADVEGVACNSIGGYGPNDFGNGQGTIPTFGGAQEATAVTNYPAGVYNLLPLKGIIVWNSHSFNLTGFDMNLEAWLNMEFTSDLTYPSIGLFDTKNIFLQNIPPYEEVEYCDTHTFPGNQTINLFDISSHTHFHGKRWRFYQAPQTPCPDPSPCAPGDPADMFYESFEYSDPLYLEFDPPIQYPSTGNAADRTIKYCALYDNGAVDRTEVKRRSTSPCPPIGSCDAPVNPDPDGNGVDSNAGLGGRCPIDGSLCVGGANAGTSCGYDNSNCSSGNCVDYGTGVKCLDGPNEGLPCLGDDANCPTSVCDACNARGGVTTGDEMFIPLGTYYETP